MNRYRSYGAQDDQPQVAGDQAFLGVNEYDTPQNLQPGEVQKAVNLDFKNQAAETRGGFVCLPELGANPLGLAFIDRTAPIDTSSYVWTAVAYGAGTFAAVSNIGSGKRAMTSPDGVTWTSQATPADNPYVAIAYGAGVFSALTSDGSRGMYSADGITWTQSAITSQLSANGLTFGGGKFVAALDGGQMAYSTDGINWTAVSAGTNDWGDVTYGNGRYVAVSLNTGTLGKRSAVSTDAITWTVYTTIHPSQTGITYGNGLYVSCGISYAFPRGGVQYSSDGQTWLDAAVPDELYLDIVFANNLFIAVSTTGTCIKSNDGIHWSSITISSHAWKGVAYGASSFVVVGGSGGTANIASANDDFVYASSTYSDPNAANEVWIMLALSDRVVFSVQGRTSKSVSYGVGLTVSESGTLVQANNYVYLFRGANATPLYWDGNWNGTFVEVPATALPASFNSIPNSNQATYYQNRLWVKDGKDEVAASDVLAFTDYDPLANEFNLNTGNSDYLVATFPFGQNSLIAFKNKSVLLLQNVEGSLSDVTVTEVTRQVGLVGINAVCSIGPDLAYASYRNINLLTLTSTNNSLQHKTLPLSAKIRKIMDRVNWEQGAKISMGYWNNRLYVALPIDNSLVCNCVVVYNFITDRWYGEWNFSDTLNMCIQGWQVVDYLGLQRMHAITEDGRIFVTDEGQNDISGTTLAEISTELITRAYMTQNLNHFQRRMFMDVATNRPKFSVWVYTEGASEESSLLTDQTYTRSQSWLFNDESYDLTNANDDYNRAYRKDYSTGPNSVQSGTGFQPEMLQEERLPLIARRQGRLSWIKLTNTQGLLTSRTLGYETRPGQRANLTQV